MYSHVPEYTLFYAWMEQSNFTGSLSHHSFMLFKYKQKEKKALTYSFYYFIKYNYILGPH